MAEIKINYTGGFTRSQIAGIRAISAGLGDHMAAQAFLGGATAGRVRHETAGRVVRKTHIAVEDSSVWKLNTRFKKLPRAGTQLLHVIEVLIKNFVDEQFFYLNVKEAADSLGMGSATAANLRANGYIIPA